MPDGKDRGIIYELRRNAVGFAGSLYNSLAGQAPAYSIASGAALIMGSSAAAAPLAMVVTLLGVLTIIYSIMILGRRFPHAASFYAYDTNALNSSIGFLNGIVYTILYSIIGVGSVAIAFAYLGTEGVYAIVGHPVNPLILLPIPVVLALIPAVLGIRPSIRTEMALTSIEIVILLFFIALTLATRSSNLSLIPFTPQGTFQRTIGGVLASLSGGLVFAITFFMGFEVSTQISEETKDPRRSVPLGTMWATVIMGILYTLVTYAVVVNVGYSEKAISNFVALAQSGPNPIYAMMGRYLGEVGLYLFAISVMFSVFGCYLATLNATARMLYGMARDGLLPRWLAETHPRFKSPHKAIYFSTAIAALTIALSYAASYLSGSSNSIQLTYNAMEYAYAIDSLYYVLSLILVAIAAFRIVGGWASRVVLAIGVALLSITFYYSIANIYYLIIFASSIAIVVVFELTVLRNRLRVIKQTICPYC